MDKKEAQKILGYQLWEALRPFIIYDPNLSLLNNSFMQILDLHVLVCKDFYSLNNKNKYF